GLDTLGAGAIIQYSSWSATARECVYALLKAVEEANKINQDNTTIIVVDIKEKVVAVPQQEVNVAPVESLSKAASAPAKPTPVVYRKPQQTKSKSGFLKLIILLLLAGAGYYAWQQGMLDGMISGVTEQVEQQLKPAEPEVITKPEAEIVTPVEQKKPRELVKQPEISEPVPVSEPQVQKQFVNKHASFNDPLKAGGHAPMVVKISGGTFRMGDTSGLISADETPRHEVKLGAFFMSVNEVTYAEYDVFAKATKRKLPDSGGQDRKNHPVSNVSWDDALAYTRWLSKQTGKKYRLPSEAEWEYAARGGQRTTYWWGTSKGTAMAHCFNCGSELSTGKSAKVGSYKSNQFGLNDTAGNLYEWVHDCYHRNYNDAPDDGSVWDGGDCSVRIVRGGAFRSPASSMRVENRETFPSNKGQYNVGIRLARD
ncbi:MAG: SUMF1/EgtB/PvdO family nonheme iron enzyme, partial [Gammaproteobacteria bacterium]|nr:SUMF1/EgtB/PvdO family nonheme iron enzyme [Gammaproteobacteria bacterium]